ncbi:ABC transporter-like protein [Metarhizium album ARSEF 1941]|uniref:ABC transporter-like protein n=1 Tax=Metarhizium album (strain ARSEF 1941) TaxID=1081103 RepID=A0A0B2X5K7_METAS|nr:ABC transporter-like protein [Metarhizium album ARSEF 1941]KHO01664.1 ABC transporter-like protein [Metarhizium album ARSEF 1941]
MAFLLPIVLSSFFSFAKNLLVPPANYGIGQIRPVMTLPEAFRAANGSGRTKVVLVNNGFAAGDIDRLLDRVANAATATDVSMKVVRISREDDLATTCRSSLRGVSTCFCAVVMRSSPTEGPGGFWNYTIRTDAAFWREPVKFDALKSTNVEQVYILPMQRAVDAFIAAFNGSAEDPLAKTDGLPFASMSQAERNTKVRQAYHKAIVNFMAVAFIANILWVTYHLTGFVATERESGMSQLIDSMMPVDRPWKARAVRIIAHHLSFSMIYAPAWIIGSIIIRFGVFVKTSIAVVLFFNLFSGLSFVSMSILFASFFKKAQLSSITTLISILLLGILAQALTRPTIGPVATLSVLFAPCNYVYFLTFMAKFEKQNTAADLARTPPASSWAMPGVIFFIIAIAQIIVYPLLGAMVEKNLYSTTTDGRKIQLQEGGEGSLLENAVELNKLTKIYYPSFFSRVFSFTSKPREPVVAVNELSFQARRGQIVALLGANGSGKSTTLDAIAGLHKLTSGSISIDGRGGLGIAPQKNVLWDDLTVQEHLVTFNRLKTGDAPASKAEILELIRSIDLFPKRNALAKTLSGGQKRKLQLGMMLTGGSAVCCVDEVSSGLDPLSRRKIWDILLAERGRRTLILTTHFLDEADLLADHIAILSKGSLRAQGSSVELKDRFGSGYRVHVEKNSRTAYLPSIPGVQKKEAFESATYVAPTSNLAAQVIRSLEGSGVSQYRFSGPTIEDVFLQLAEEIKDEEAFKGASAGVLGEVDGTNEKDLPSSTEGSTLQGLRLLDGKRVGYVKQALILSRKRLTVLKRNWILYLIAFLLPIFAAGLTALYVRGKKQVGCAPADQVSSSVTEDAFTQVKNTTKIIFLAGPASRLSVATVTGLLQPIFNGSRSGASVGSAALQNLRLVDSFDDWKQQINNEFRNITTAVWLGDETSNPTVGWVANLFITSSITSQQVLDIFLTNTTIATTWSSFDVPFNPGIGDALSLVVYMGLALSCYPAFFALYPTGERRRFVRALQYSNGVRPFPLWGAYLLFDFTIAVISTALLTALWAGISSIWFHLEYVFVVFLLYGLASILYSYFVSLFTKSQLATFAWSAASQAVFFLGYLIAYICVVTFAEVDDIDSLLLICHFVISIFSPVANATRAMFLATNLFATACDGGQVSKKPARLVGYGGPILYLAIQCVVLFSLLLWFDSGSVGSSIRGLFRRSEPVAVADELATETADELTRGASPGQTGDGLRVVHLTKSFGKNTAVDNVSFGIKRGEVFALLGPNGAGKSTTISLIRGDIKPSPNGGDIFVEDVSVSRDLAAARTHLGVCPQVDALDQMTVREHLEFYARIRGVPDIEHNVSAVLQAVGLEAFASRMGYALSGGNKRKLSLGIALMGNPTVVLLDEPSSGLDAASKRIMWKTLAATVHGRSILLTTHSMEEADALAGRAGILSRRMIALGTPDNLRHRFGDMLHVHLVSSAAPRTTDEEMQRLISWIQARLPSAKVDTKTYHGQLRFCVSASEMSVLHRQGANSTAEDITLHDSDMAHAARQGSAMGQLIVLLEENKKMLGLSHYSVSPTTLDQVFLAIVSQHNVREENYEEKRQSGWFKLICFQRPKN